MDEYTLAESEAVKRTVRERAKNEILQFTKYTKPDYQINWHHRLLGHKLDAFVRGDIRFLMVFMPPRHGKSELVSRRLPALLHGKYPDSEIMACSYLDSLAGDMTIAVQNVIDSKEYHEIFPDTKIWAPGTSYTKGTRNSSEHHIVGRRGKYRGQGVGGSFTGKGANFIIIDDPIKGREIADSIAFRERLWNFYNNDLFTRLETDIKNGRPGQVLITQCMTGDTRVLMADGTETLLKNIKIGDVIATYDNGIISTSTIKNWKCNGPDLVYAIKTISGITVKANERHPFLVCRNGEMQWVRLRDLRVNEKMIGVGEHGKVCNANCAISQLSVKDTVPPTITKQDGHQDIDHHLAMPNHTERDICGIGTELNCQNIIESLPTRMENVQSVKPLESLQLTGNKNYALTTATTQTKSEDYYAMNAISLSGMETQKKYCLEHLNIYEYTIVEISEIGYEDVFDIQVDRTENFIANGLVSHNTRWHEDDLSGRLIDLMNKDPQAVQWDILSLPAIRVDKDNEYDPREIGEALWPKKYNIDQLNQIKAALAAEGGVRGWSSLFQQSPVPDGGGLFKDRMFAFSDLPGGYDFTFITADTAYEEKQENDFHCFTAWGVKGEQPYVIDVIMQQIKAVDAEAWAMPFIKRYSQWGFRGCYIEPKGHGIYLNQSLRRKGIMIPHDNDIKDFYSDRNKDKVSRANAATPHLANRKIYISNNIANKETLVAQCLSFPKVKHDDFVDTVIDGVKMIYGRSVSLLDLFVRNG